MVAVALAGALLAVLSAIPAWGSARPATWVASGSLTGSYTNDVAWVQCQLTGASGTAHETATADAKLTSLGRPRTLGGNGIALLMRMQPGGSWSIDGSYPPHVDLPNGDQGCGPQQPLHCAGQMVAEGDRMVLGFIRRGATLHGDFLQNQFLKEADDIDSQCPTQDSSGRPLFGLASSQIEVDVFAENDGRPDTIDVPVARFRGRKAFTITRTAGPDGGCDQRFYATCSESGSLTLTLRFTPR